jgi:Intracellular proteinase inhibitor
MTPSIPPGLDFRATLPPQVAAGDSVRVTLRLTNTGAAPRDVYLMGREIAYDVVVLAPDGSPVWSRLAGETVPAILQIRTLPPGGSLTFHAAWSGRTAGGRPAPPGEYTVRGYLPTDDARLETPPVPLRIVGR